MDASNYGDTKSERRRVNPSESSLCFRLQLFEQSEFEQFARVLCLSLSLSLPLPLSLSTASVFYMHVACGGLYGGCERVDSSFALE